MIFQKIILLIIFYFITSYLLSLIMMLYDNNYKIVKIFLKLTSWYKFDYNIY